MNDDERDGGGSGQDALVPAHIAMRADLMTPLSARSSGVPEQLDDDQHTGRAS